MPILQANKLPSYFAPLANVSSLPQRAKTLPPAVAAPQTASAPAHLSTARALVTAFTHAGKANGYVQFKRAVRALPPPKTKFWTHVFTEDVKGELWGVFSEALKTALGEQAWRTCSSVPQFECICKVLQNKQFGELGKHVSHVLMRDLVAEVPDDAKSSEVIGHLHKGPRQELVLRRWHHPRRPRVRRNGRGQVASRHGDAWNARSVVLLGDRLLAQNQCV